MEFITVWVCFVCGYKNFNALWKCAGCGYFLKKFGKNHCQICNADFITLSELGNHVLTRHRERNRPGSLSND